MIRYYKRPIGKTVYVTDGTSDFYWTATTGLASFYAVPGLGWIALGYSVANIGWQVYTSNTVTQSIFGEK